MHTSIALEPAIRNVWVTIDKTKLRVDKDVATISKLRGEEVEWFSRDNEDFTVVFKHGSPFATDEFLVPRGGSVCSGPAVNGLVGKHYKYSILDSGSTEILDPQVVIKD